MSRSCVLSLLGAISVVAACATGGRGPVMADAAALADGSSSASASASDSATATASADESAASAEARASASDSAELVDLSAEATDAVAVVPTASEQESLVCRREVAVGSHMRRRVCYTESELAQQRQEAQQLLRQSGARVPGDERLQTPQ